VSTKRASVSSFRRLYCRVVIEALANEVMPKSENEAALVDCFRPDPVSVDGAEREHEFQSGAHTTSA